MAGLALHFFGFPQVTRDGAPVELRRRKEIALLAYLAVTQRAHSRDSLAALLWPGYDQTSARGSLRRSLSNVNRKLEAEWLDIDHEHVALPPQTALWIDVVFFHAHLDEYRRKDEHCPTYHSPLVAAVELYKDDFLAGFSLVDAPEFGIWQVNEAESLRREYGHALQQLTQCLARTGDYAEAIAYARRWLELDPLHEPAHRTLMQLHALAGDRSAAIRQYKACGRALAAELDVPPEPETTTLFEHIRSGKVSIRATDRVAIVETDGQRQYNLPKQLTPFVGRTRDLAQIGRRLADPHCRLLTIIGPGGIGKTRLAIQAAQQQRGRFSDGVCFVDLTPVGPPDLLASSILHAVAPDEYGDANARRRLCEWLQGKQLLLVLDSIEHLLEGAGLLPDLLRCAPAFKILVTSRQRLNLRDEWLEPLDGLAYPAQDEVPANLQGWDSTRLFLDCVRRVLPGWQPSPSDVTAIADICRTLEGMPLGIELAAAWTRLLPLEEVGGELARGQSILSTSLRDVPARHRSMTAVFDQSWAMLEPKERSVLRQMSVFRGGCTREAAEAVTGAGLAELAAMVDSSWLRLRANGRYDMHELVRQYCEGRLEAEHESATGEMPTDVRRRHCDNYVSMIREPDPKSEPDDIYVRNLELEYHNLGAALIWAVKCTHLAAVNSLANSLRLACFMLGWLDPTYQYLSNAAEVLDNQLDGPDGDSELKHVTIERLARIRNWQIPIASNLGRFQAAGEHIDQLDLLTKKMPPGPQRLFNQYRVVFERCVQMWHLGEYKASRKHGYEALSLSQDKGFVYFRLEARVSQAVFQAHALAAIAYASFYLGLYDEAEKKWRESIAIADTIGEKRDRAEHCAQLSRLLVMTGAHAQAQDLAQEALRRSQEWNSRVWIGMAYLAMGDVRAALGDTKESRRYLSLGIEIWKRTRFVRLIDSITLFGRVELAEGDTKAAISRFHIAIREMQIHGAEESAYMIAAWHGLGWAMLAEDNAAKADEWFRKALATGICAAWEKSEGIAGLAEVAALEGRIEEAVELLALVVKHPFTAYAQREKSKRSLFALRKQIAPSLFAMRVQAGEQRDLDETLAELVSFPQPRSLDSRIGFDTSREAC